MRKLLLLVFAAHASAEQTGAGAAGGEPAPEPAETDELPLSLVDLSDPEKLGLTVAKHRVVFVNFWDTHCVVCKDTVEPWVQAAHAAYNFTPPAIFGSVNLSMTGGQRLSKLYSITQTPTLMLFVGGREQQPYFGDRSAPSLLQYLKRTAYPHVQTLNSAKELRWWMGNTSAATSVAVQFAEAYGQKGREFAAVVEKHMNGDMYDIGYAALSPKVAKKNSLILKRDVLGQAHRVQEHWTSDTDVVVEHFRAQWGFSREAIDRWLMIHSRPLVQECEDVVRLQQHMTIGNTLLLVVRDRDDPKIPEYRRQLTQAATSIFDEYHNRSDGQLLVNDTHNLQPLATVWWAYTYADIPKVGRLLRQAGVRVKKAPPVSLLIVSFDEARRKPPEQAAKEAAQRRAGAADKADLECEEHPTTGVKVCSPKDDGSSDFPHAVPQLYLLERDFSADAARRFAADFVEHKQQYLRMGIVDEHGNRIMSRQLNWWVKPAALLAFVFICVTSICCVRCTKQVMQGNSACQREAREPPPRKPGSAKARSNKVD